MNTLIGYSYRDGGNNKRSGTWIISGMCSQKQAAALRAACFKEDEFLYFVPSAVGMPDLQPTQWDDEIDHPYHEITDIEMTGGDAQDRRSMHDMLEAFRACDWRVAAAAVSVART